MNCSYCIDTTVHMKFTVVSVFGEECMLGHIRMTSKREDRSLLHVTGTSPLLNLGDFWLSHPYSHHNKASYGLSGRVARKKPQLSLKQSAVCPLDIGGLEKSGVE